MSDLWFSLWRAFPVGVNHVWKLGGCRRLKLIEDVVRTERFVETHQLNHVKLQHVLYLIQNSSGADRGSQDTLMKLSDLTLYYMYSMIKRKRCNGQKDNQ